MIYKHLCRVLNPRQFIEISKEACAQHKEKMKKLQDELLDSRTAALLTKSELEGTVKTTQAKLQTAQIDLVRPRTL